MAWLHTSRHANSSQPEPGNPLSPIDHIKERIADAGYSIGEVTGRQSVVERGVIRPRNKAEMNTAGKKNTIAEFNGGQLDALIINRSGSTGLSMHASETFSDQRRRVMVVAQAELDISNHADAGAYQPNRPGNCEWEVSRAKRHLRPAQICAADGQCAH